MLIALRHSLRQRMLWAFLLLTLFTAGVFGTVTYLGSGKLIHSLVLWRMQPIMDLLIDAEERAELADDRGADKSMLSYGADLAATLGVTFYVGKEIPPYLRKLPSGLHRLEGPHKGMVVLIRITKTGQYALLSDLNTLKKNDGGPWRVFLFCITISLGMAALLAFLLSRRLITPLLELAQRAASGRLPEDSPLHARKDEVGLLARALTQRERALQEFLTREQLFTGDVSHELRTPLTVMLGGVEILESHLETGKPVQPDQLHPILERMRRTLDDMRGTVNTMLLLARKPEQLEHALLDMSALCLEHARRVQHQLRPEVALHTDIDPGVAALGNGDLANVILHNVLDNARLYTDQGEIRLTLRSDGFSVANTGPPIAPELRARMFQRGQRGAGQVPGSGLGLSLVQRACELLGWTVTHTLPPQGGNCFNIVFTNNTTAVKDREDLARP